MDVDLVSATIISGPPCGLIARHPGNSYHLRAGLSTGFAPKAWVPGRSLDGRRSSRKCCQVVGLSLHGYSRSETCVVIPLQELATLMFLLRFELKPAAQGPDAAGTEMLREFLILFAWSCNCVALGPNQFQKP